MAPHGHQQVWSQTDGCRLGIARSTSCSDRGRCPHIASPPVPHHTDSRRLPAPPLRGNGANPGSATRWVPTPPTMEACLPGREVLGTVLRPLGSLIAFQSGHVRAGSPTSPLAPCLVGSSVKPQIPDASTTFRHEAGTNRRLRIRRRLRRAESDLVAPPRRRSRR